MLPGNACTELQNLMYSPNVVHLCSKKVTLAIRSYPQIVPNVSNVIKWKNVESGALAREDVR